MTKINKKILRGFLIGVVVLLVFSSLVYASEFHTTHFYVTYDKSEFRYEDVRQILGTLGRVHYKIAPALGFTPTSETEVILYSSPEKFRNVLGRPEWCGGAYDGKIHVPLMPGMKSVKDLEPVLRHEYTHAILHLKTKGNCPIWLHEGLAQYFEGIYEDKELDNKRIGILAELWEKEDKFLPLNRTSQFFKSKDPASVALAYFTSYTSVKYIISRFGLGGVRSLLDELAVVRSPDPIQLVFDNGQAFKNALRIDYFVFTKIPPICLEGQEKEDLSKILKTEVGKKERIKEIGYEEWLGEKGKEKETDVIVDEAYVLFTMGQNYEANKRYDLAIKQYQKIIESYPDSPYAGSAEQRVKELKSK